MPIIYKSFCDTRQIDDDQQAFKMLDKVSHLKKFSAEEGDDDNTFVQLADDITAVSYTHLDVYKRQTLHRLKRVVSPVYYMQDISIHLYLSTVTD